MISPRNNMTEGWPEETGNEELAQFTEAFQQRLPQMSDLSLARAEQAMWAEMDAKPANQIAGSIWTTAALAASLLLAVSGWAMFFTSQDEPLVVTVHKRDASDREIAMRIAESSRIGQLSDMNIKLAKHNVDLANAQADTTTKLRHATSLHMAAEDRSRFTDSVNTQLTDFIKSSQKAITAGQVDSAKLRLQFIELVNRNKSLLNQIETLSHVADRQEEELAAAYKRIAEFEMNDPSVLAYTILQDRSEKEPFFSPVLIQGQITRVEKVGGDTFVQIDVGQKHDVKQNMKFLVHRGELYVGSLVITFVDEQTAAGEIRFPGKDTMVKAGDGVVSGQRLLITPRRPKPIRKKAEKPEPTEPIDLLKNEYDQIVNEMEKQTRHIRIMRQSVIEKQKQLAATEVKLKRFADRNSRTPNPKVIAKKEIRSKITRLVNLTDRFAQINVGSSSGVRNGMRFVIYRGDERIGEMITTSVTPNHAAGVVYVNPHLNIIKVGDVAVTGPGTTK